MSVSHPTGLRREQPIDKAHRLLAAGAVTLASDARVYDVAGDSGVYRVIAEPDGITCPCPAHTPLCSHVLAVAALRTVPPASDEFSVRRAVIA